TVTARRASRRSCGVSSRTPPRPGCSRLASSATDIMSETQQPGPQAEVAGDGAPMPQRDPGDDAGTPVGGPVDGPVDSPVDGPVDGPVEGPVGSPIGTPGQLAAAREARGWSVSDVASKLGMVPRQIEAIERGDWAALPGQAFVRGAIRA